MMESCAALTQSAAGTPKKWTLTDILYGFRGISKVFGGRGLTGSDWDSYISDMPDFWKVDILYKKFLYI